MEMEHYLEYIDNDVWKVIQMEIQRRESQLEKIGCLFEYFLVSGCRRRILLLFEKATRGRIEPSYLWTIPKDTARDFMEMDFDKKILGKHIGLGRGGNANYKKMTRSFLLITTVEALYFINITEDANQQVSRIFAPSSLVKSGNDTGSIQTEVDTLSMMTLYNNLRVFEEKNFTKNAPSIGNDQNYRWKRRRKRDSFYQDQGAGKKEQNQNCLLTMDDGVVNWGEHTVEEEETNHALMAISSNNEVSLCSKTCIDSYNKLKTLCDEQMNQLGEQEAKILAYTLAVKKLEAQVVTFQKQQLSLNEQLTFQANEIYAKDEKLKKYRRIGMKAVKEKEQLQKIVDSWKNSSKNLWKLVDSGMTSNSKVGLGYEIQSNNEVLSYEEEMNRTVFKCTEEDFLNKPLYSRFSKTDNFKGVPHPLTGDYTPKPQEEIDDSLYVYGKKGPQKPEISDSDDNSTEHSTCQSNDSEGSFGNPSEHSSESESESISVPNEMSTSKSVTTNEKVVSESKEVEPSCVTHVKTPRQPMKNQGTPKVKGKNWNEMMERKLGEGYSFIKKKCFVCGSLSHLIKDCDFYEKKMAREAELKKQRVFNTGNGVAKPVWNNANRVNHANQFVPRPVQLNTGRANVNSVRPNVNTGRATVNSVRQNVNSVRSNVNTGSFNINTGRSKQPVPTSNSNSFSPVRPQDHPLKNMEDRGIFDSGCSAHMTGNQVGFLKKPKESTGFAEIVDFIKGSTIRGFRGVPRPLFHAMLPVVVVDQGAGQADQAMTQPSPSKPLPSSSPPPVISAITGSEPTPVVESTSHTNSLSPEPDNEPIEHTFEQPSSEHQPLLPKQETEIPQS
ncbi:hypothetical protein Tco_0109945 [Tanacetum coccineum]